MFTESGFVQDNPNIGLLSLLQFAKQGRTDKVTSTIHVYNLFRMII